MNRTEAGTESPAPLDSPALARHKFQMAKLEADSWARIIADACVAALEDWHQLPTRATLARFREAKAVESSAREVMYSAEARSGVAS